MLKFRCYLDPNSLPFSYENFQAMFAGATFTDYLHSIAILQNLPIKARKQVVHSLAPHFKTMSDDTGRKYFGDSYFICTFQDSNNQQIIPSDNQRVQNLDNKNNSNITGLISFVMHMLQDSNSINAFGYINKVLNIVNQPLSELKNRLFPNIFFLSHPSTYLILENHKSSWAFSPAIKFQLKEEPPPFRNNVIRTNQHPTGQYIQINDFLFERNIEPQNCYVSTHKYKEEIAHLFYTLYYDKEDDKACWTIFPPETDLILNNHLIGKDKHEIIHIHDNISNAQNNSDSSIVNTWVGHNYDYPNLNSSSFKCTQVKFYFDKNNKESIKKALFLYESILKTKNDLILIHKGPLKPESNPSKKNNSEDTITYKDLLALAKNEYNIFKDNKEENSNYKIHPLKLKTANQFKKNTTKEHFLIEPLFKQSEIVILVAKQKSGKSLFALDLSIMLASGGNIGSRLKAHKPQKVLFVDGEMPEGEISTRIENLKQNYNFDDHIKNLDFLCLRGRKNGLNLLNETDQKALENTINNHKLLVLDNLGKLISRRGEMNVHQWNSFFIWLRKLTRSGLTILIIHHENKTGQHRGTGKMTDDVDLVISIKNPKRKADATSIEVNIEDPRFLYGKACDPFRLAYYISGKREVITDQASTQTPLSLSDENFAFEINTPNLKEREKRILKTIFRLLLLEGRTSFKRSDIMEDEPDAYGESSITKALDKLVQNDLLSKEGDGKGRRYQLTETGRSIYQSKRD